MENSEILSSMPSSIRSDLLSPLRYDTNMRIVKCITQYGARRNARKSKGLLFYRRTIGCSAPMTREKSWRGAVWHHYGLYKKKKKDGKRANCISARKI